MRFTPEPDMRLVLITRPELVPGEADMLESLMQAGVSCLYIRKPGAAGSEVKRLLGGLSPRFHKKLILPVDLLQDFPYPDAGGFHVTEQVRRRTATPVLAHWKQKAGFLTTSVHRGRDYDTLPSCFDAAFFGPVFDSISKEGYKAMAPEEREVLKRKRHIRIIALGGISGKTLEGALAAGFDGAAVMGGVWQEENPVTAFRKLKTITEKHAYGNCC